MNIDPTASGLLLSQILWLPVFGALLCVAFVRFPEICRVLALSTALFVFSLTLIAATLSGNGWFLYQDSSWIDAFGIRYTLGMDGISLLFVILTAFLQVVAILVAWHQDKYPAFFFALLLLLETAIIGVFLALDMILFYLFWELMLIPLFFLIGIWGNERRVYAAIKFLFFTLAGSLCMLLAMIALYQLHGEQTGIYTFAFDSIRQTQLTAGQELLFFLCFMSAFAVKVPIFPFHSWLPDAHSEAPASGAVDLAGLILKTGVYAMLRFAFPLFPNAAKSASPYLAGLGLFAIFYAAWIAYRQTDLKRIVAYSSMSHLGFVVIGLVAWNQTAWEGSLLLMFNHAISTGGVFVAAAIIQQRCGSRQLDDLGGLWHTQPRLSAFFLLFCLASLGLPGLANFAGEILILIGTFQTNPGWAILAVGGVLFSAIYILRMVQGTIWGPSCCPEDASDLNRREWLVLVPLAILVVLLGSYPQPLLDQFSEPIAWLLNQGGTP